MSTDYDAATGFLGPWGRFQQQVFFLLCVSFIPNGFTGMSVVFVADTPPHRCLIPASANLSAAWRNSSIPLEEGTGSGSGSGSGTGTGTRTSQCSRYRLQDVRRYSERGLLPGVDVDLSTVPTERCVDGWEYEHSVYTSTIVSEWDLVCEDRWKTPLTSSLFFCGVLLGSFVSGQLSDRYGRKLVLFSTMALQTVSMYGRKLVLFSTMALQTVSMYGRKLVLFSTMALQTVSMLVLVFSPSWTVFCAVFFVVGAASISNYVTGFVLGTEILGPSVRTVFSTAGSSLCFGLGYTLLPLVAFFIRDWRTLVLSLTLPGFLYVPFWWWIPESPRWLLSQGRVDEAEAVIKEAARRNKLRPPPLVFTPPPQKEVQRETREEHNICDLLRSRNIRWISVTLWLVWNVVAIAYFALSLNTANLYGDAYFNCFLSAAVEMPAYALSWVMFRWFSRRRGLALTLVMGGAFLLLVQLVPANLDGLSVTLEMMGKFSVSISFAIVYAYTAELYPTVLRNTAVGTCSMASRIGSIIAPYFIYLRSYSVALPYILMGSLTAAAGLLSLLLPESFGMPLPDTISHMQHFPGCCQKRPYALTHTEEKENADETKPPVLP